ncbi:MAG: coproporphyrinogen dehydrogenase [Bacteroidetes bacterium]|nr:coproporphyrinogen dehydrogenase [Bacteroidota bacterium]
MPAIINMMPEPSSLLSLPITSEENVAAHWKNLLLEKFNATNGTKGISLYVHLPFCERLCTFCSFKPHITINHKVEQIYVDMLLKEWQLYLALFEKKPIIKQIYFGGGTPTFFTPENLKRIINFIKDTAEVSPKAELSIEANISNTSALHLTTLYKAGFNTISFGIQDFDHEVQQTIRRTQATGKVFHITSLARSVGFKVVNYDILYGLPNQSRKTIINTIYRINEIKPERISLLQYIHDPKSFPSQKPYEQKLPVPEEAMKLAEIARCMLLESGYTEIGMGVFVLKKDPLYKAFKHKTIHRNLMGYTQYQTEITVGIGAGAISDVWDAIAINRKKIRKYYQCLENGEIPINSCFKIDGAKLALRNHIYNLQCNLQTSWEGNEKGYLLKISKRFQSYPFQNLIKVSETGIKIKKAGRQYIHNC